MSEFSFRKVTNFIAFVGIVLCAISIIIGKWVPIFGEIAGIIALSVMALCAFFFVKAKRSPAYMIIFALCVILIIVFKAWAILA